MVSYPLQNEIGIKGAYFISSKELWIWKKKEKKGYTKWNLFPKKNLWGSIFVVLTKLFMR